MYNGWDLFGFFIIGVVVVLLIIYFSFAIDFAFDDEKKRKLKKIEYDVNILNVLENIVYNTNECAYGIELLNKKHNKVNKKKK